MSSSSSRKKLKARVAAIAFLTAEDIDWTDRTIGYNRKKLEGRVARPPLVHFGEQGSGKTFRVGRNHISSRFTRFHVVEHTQEVVRFAGFEKLLGARLSNA